MIYALIGICAVAAWLAYGCLLGDVVVAASGALGAGLSGLLLWQAVRYRMEEP